MPAMTQLVRDGQPLPLRWGFWVLSALKEARAAELGVEASSLRTFPSEPHTFTSDHRFEDKDEDTGHVYEVLEVKRGDVFRAWWEAKS